MNEKHMRTRLVHAGENELAKKIASSVSVPKVLPIYMSSVFSFDDVPSLDAVYAGDASGYVYSRMTNPSTDAVEEILAAAEGADGALVFASGMAAIVTSIIANVKSGDHVVSSPVLYGGVYDYFKHELPRFGVEVTFVDFEDMDALKAAIRPNTKVVYTETISNPLMEVLNLPEIAKAAHAHGCKFIVDNTLRHACRCPAPEDGRGHRGVQHHQVFGRPQRPHRRRHSLRRGKHQRDAPLLHALRRHHGPLRGMAAGQKPADAGSAHEAAF